MNKDEQAIIVLEWKEIKNYEDCSTLTFRDAPNGYIYAMTVDGTSCWYIGETRDWQSRYNSSYDHLVSGFIKLGGKIFVGKIVEVKKQEFLYGMFAKIIGAKPAPNMIRKMVEDDLILINNPIENDRDSNCRGLVFVAGEPNRAFESSGDVPSFVSLSFSMLLRANPIRRNIVR